jgi:ABC-type proline/glycine betaine transport system permease subunit
LAVLVNPMPHIFRLEVKVTVLLLGPVLEKLQMLPVVEFELLLPSVGDPTQLEDVFATDPAFAQVTVVCAVPTVMNGASPVNSARRSVREKAAGTGADTEQGALEVVGVSMAVCSED